MPDSPLLVIGVGNEARGDDAAGILAARAVARSNPPGVVVIEHGGEGADLAEVLGRGPRVVLVDALRSGAEPGTIRRIDAVAEALPETSFASGSTHAFGVADGIELARALETLPHELVIYGIEGGDFTAGAPPQAPVARAADEVARRILDEVG